LPRASRICIALATTAAALAPGVPAASAALVPVPRPIGVVAHFPPVTRYATPDGSSSPLNPCDDSGNPCTLQRAIATAIPGDEIVVEPGDYPESLTIVLDSRVYIHGVAGQPRPRILSSTYGGAAALQVNAPGTRLRDLEVQHTGRGVLLLGTADSVRESVVRTTGKSACELQADAQTIADTLCATSPAYEPALGLYTGASNERFYVRNVTAVGNYVGLGAFGGYRGGTGGIDATVVNSILRGGSYDVYTRATSPSYSKAYLSYSNYDRSHSLEQDNSLIWNAGNNQSTSPAFVSPTPDSSSDYHQAVGSPTIDAGQTDDANNGPFDFDGDPRTIGAATDIGADEFVPPTQRTTGGATGAPAIGPASLLFGLFAVDPRGPTATPAAAARPVGLGTIIDYTLSKRARVRFTISDARSRFVARFSQPGRAGPNSKPWWGKVGRTTLAAGSYSMTLLATDAHGRRSQPKRLIFKIVRR
jgi:hypothetical protein